MVSGKWLMMVLSDRTLPSYGLSVVIMSPFAAFWLHFFSEKFQAISDQ